MLRLKTQKTMQNFVFFVVKKYFTTKGTKENTKDTKGKTNVISSVSEKSRETNRFTPVGREKLTIVRNDKNKKFKNKI